MSSLVLFFLVENYPSILKRVISLLVFDTYVNALVFFTSNTMYFDVMDSNFKFEKKTF